MAFMATKKTARRIVAALDVYLGSEDPMDRLDAARRSREAAQELESDALGAARQAGATWKDIGDCYGLTKQGAQQRFGRTSSAHASAAPGPRKKGLRGA